jgi:hypothetical protein
MQNGPSWSITFDDGVARNIRVTVSGYSSQRVQGTEEPSFFEFTAGDEPAVRISNEVSGDASEFLPAPVIGFGDYFSYESGVGSETHRDEQYEMLVEVDAAAAPNCQEIGRATRAYASAYTLDRVHIVRAIRTQQRCLIADFNGAIPKGRVIVSATWRCTAPWITILSDAAIAPGGRAAQVTAKLGNCGFGHVKCSVTLDNGETYIQMFEVRVVVAPWFYENFDQPGPYELTVTA